MNTGSAFARVIGITKSLSPLSFDRSRDREADPAAETLDDAADQTVAAVLADSPALPNEANVAASAAESGATAEPVAVGETARDDADKPLELIGPVAPPDTSVVVQFPALAQVTVVAEAAPAPESVAESARPDRIREEVAGDMIDAIETDIASLLASMEPGVDDGDEAVAAADAASPVAADDEDAKEEPTLMLLSELNRMWRADPRIAASRFS